MESTKTSIIASAVQQLPAICPAEIHDLERMAGRPLSQQQATRYRLRKLKQELIAAMLAGGVR